MGYKRAGFRVVGNCEIDETVQKLYTTNLHPKYPFTLDVRDFLKLQDLPEELYSLDVLDGSPPCTTFSMAGDREKTWGVKKKFAEGQKEQRLDDLFFTYLSVVEKLKPKVFIAENVVGILNGNAKGYVNKIIKKSREIGYEIQIFKLNAAEMGVPQLRERVFFIGNRCGFPKLKLAFNEKPINFGEVRSEHGRPFFKDDSLHQRLLQLRRPSDRSLKSIYKRVLNRTAGFGNPINQDSAPAATVVASGAIYRGYDGLPMSEEDFRNCQSFPQDYDFCGKQAQYVCGMSVPPSMMANIAHEVMEQWLK